MLLAPSLAFVLTFALTGAPAAPVIAQPAPPRGLTFPYEKQGVCPSERCAYGRWVAGRALTVRRSRETGALPAFSVAAGEAVEAVNGVVVTVRPGRARAVAPLDVEGVRFARGAPVLLLRHVGESAYKVWAQGTELDVGGRNLIVLNEPRTIWWVQIRNRRGETGWSSEPDAFGGG
jgi:hypothetical protein